MNLQTKVRLPLPLSQRLTYGAQMLSMGSCFSEHIGEHLRYLGHHISVNPYGIVYNPVSIAIGLERLLEQRPYTESELFAFGGLCHSRQHHGAFSTASREHSLERINAAYGTAVARIQSLDYLLITWGTAWVYSEQSSGEVVANCHKRPERDFERRLWSVEELVARVRPILERLLSMSPQLRIITTISPIRHLRDGAHGNQLSKATLLLMDEALRTSLGSERYIYYPAYELVMDELRDYRFYAEDMAHPSAQTQRYIAEGFATWLMDAPTAQLSEHVRRLKAQAAHRPLHIDHPDWQLQQEQLTMLVDTFRLQHPEVLWD